MWLDGSRYILNIKADVLSIFATKSFQIFLLKSQKVGSCFWIF